MLATSEIDLVLTKEDIETILDMELDDNEFQEIVQAWDELPPYDEITEVINKWFEASFSYTIVRKKPKSFTGKTIKPTPVTGKKSWWRKV